MNLIILSSSIMSSSILTNRLGATESVNSDTILEYLEMVEDRVNKMLLVRQFIAKTDPDAAFVVKPILVGGTLHPIGLAPPNIIPPNLNSDFDDGE